MTVVANLSAVAGAIMDSIDTQNVKSSFDVVRYVDVNGVPTAVTAEVPTVNEYGLVTYGTSTQICAQPNNPSAWSPAIVTLTSLPVNAFGFTPTLVTDTGNAAGGVRIWRSSVEGHPTGPLFFRFYYKAGTSNKLKIYCEDATNGYASSAIAGDIGADKVVSSSAGALTVLRDEFLAELGCYVIEAVITFDNLSNSLSIRIGPNTVDGSNIELWGGDVFSAAYALPHVPTTGTVPKNMSDANGGYSLKLPADEVGGAYYGDASGVELVDIQVVTGQWSDNGDDTYTLTGDGAWSALTLVQDGSIVEGKQYRIRITVTDATGNLKLYPTPSVGDYAAFGNGTHEFHYVAATGIGSPAPYLNIGRDTGAVTATISNISVQEVVSMNPGAEELKNALSNGSGKMSFEWTPMFNGADASGDVNIITWADDAKKGIWYDPATGRLKVNDGTNTSYVACTPVANQTYTITWLYGDHLNGQMLLCVDDTTGTISAFDGDMSPGDYIKFAWEAEEPQAINNVVWDNAVGTSFIGRVLITKWYGKSILWLGTSIPAYGHDTFDSYPDHVAAALGATVDNEASGGSHITWDAGWYDDNWHRSLSATAAEIMADPKYETDDDLQSYETKIVGKTYDLIVIDHAYNDQYIENGDITSASDRTKFYEAYNYIVNISKAENPNASMLFLMCPNITKNASMETRLKSKREAVQALAKKHHINYLDLRSLCGFTVSDWDTYAALFPDDGNVHPTETEGRVHIANALFPTFLHDVKPGTISQMFSITESNWTPVGEDVRAGDTVMFSGDNLGAIDMTNLTEAQAASISVSIDGYVTAEPAFPPSVKFRWRGGGGGSLLIRG